MKQIISLGWMHETSAQGWCTKTQRDGMGREVGGGFRMGNTCKSMADSCQCMAKTTKYYKAVSLQLTKINKKKKKEEEFALQCRGHWFYLWSRKIPHVMGQLGLCATTTEPVL